MVEIGPGLAALTQPLVERLGRLTVIELDRDLAKRLRRASAARGGCESDVLKVDFAELAAEGADQRAARGGQPALQHLHADPLPPAGLCPLCADQHFMLQKEVIDRMVAQARHLGLQPPERDAAVALRDGERAVRAARELRSAAARRQRRGAHGAAGRSRRWSMRSGSSEIVQVAFSQRRKLLRHTLGKWLERARLRGEFDTQRRAEEVPVDRVRGAGPDAGLGKRHAVRP